MRVEVEEEERVRRSRRRDEERRSEWRRAIISVLAGPHQWQTGQSQPALSSALACSSVARQWWTADSQHPCLLTSNWPARARRAYRA